MRETFEFRVFENAKRVLGPDDGIVLSGYVRRIELEAEDPRLALIRNVQKKFCAKGDLFFAGWEIHRHYTVCELKSAELLTVEAKHVFEPEGESCGTEYDDSVACEFCGVGWRQVSELVLDIGKLRSLDFAETIASEKILSARFVDLFRKRFRGAEYRP